MKNHSYICIVFSLACFCSIIQGQEQSFTFISKTTVFDSAKTKLIDAVKITGRDFSCVYDVTPLLEWPSQSYIRTNRVSWRSISPLFQRYLENSRGYKERNGRYGKYPPIAPADTTIEQHFNDAITYLKTIITGDLIPKNDLKEYFVPINGAIQGPDFSVVKIPWKTRVKLISEGKFPTGISPSQGSDAFSARYQIGNYIIQCFLDIGYVYFIVSNKTWKPLNHVTSSDAQLVLKEILVPAINPYETKGSSLSDTSWPGGSLYIHSTVPYYTTNTDRVLNAWFDGNILLIKCSRFAVWDEQQFIDYSRDKSIIWLKK